MEPQWLRAMLEAFGRRARRIFALSKSEAKRRGQDALRCEHLLLALAREEDPGVVEILRRWGIAPADLSADIVARAPHQRRAERPDDPVVTGEAREALELALQEAVMQGDRVRAEHLLAGVMRVEASLGAAILAARGMRLPELRKEIAAVRERRLAALENASDAHEVERRKARELSKALARRLGTPPRPVLDLAALRRIDAAFARLSRTVPSKLSLLADAGGAIVTSRAELPAELPSWLPSLRPVLEPGGAARVARFSRPLGGSVMLAWVTNDVFLLVVADGDVDGVCLQGIAADIAEAL